MYSSSSFLPKPVLALLADSGLTLVNALHTKSIRLLRLLENHISQKENAPRTEKHLHLDQGHRSDFWRSTKNFFQWWYTELVASLLSVGSFVAIAFLLLQSCGSPPDNDYILPSLTLNGLVALLATIARAALMVPVASALSQDIWLAFSEKRCQLRHFMSADAASRGATGSVLFLLSPRRSWMACTAAFVTISSLSFSTFVQQAIDLRRFPVTRQDQKPRNVAHISVLDHSDLTVAFSYVNVPLAMKAAFYDGLLSEEDKLPEAQCPTANCTWPITPSLAICGACSDSSPNDVACVEGGGCTYTMPSGTKARIDNYPQLAEGSTVIQVMQGSGSMYRKNDTNMAYLTNFDVVGGPLAGYSTLIAAECALWLCVTAWATITFNGNQSQVSFGEYPHLSNASFEPSFSHNGSRYGFSNLPSNMNAQPNSNFTYAQEDYFALQDFLAPLLSGKAQLFEASPKYTNDVMQAVLQASTVGNATAGLNAWITRAATSMTNALRTDHPEHDDMYDGIGYQLGYNIDWRWIILPAILVILSPLLLIATIVKTAKNSVPPWKSSPLAMLFTQPSRDLKGMVAGHMDDYNGFQDKIGKTNATLEKCSNGGWLLAKYEDGLQAGPERPLRGEAISYKRLDRVSQ